MYARRPLQALPMEAPTKDLKTTPKSAKDLKMDCKTPSDAGRMRMALSSKNVAVGVHLDKSRPSRPSRRDVPPSGQMKIASSRPRPPKPPALSTRMPFTIFQDDVTPSVKKTPAEDAENIRPTLGVRPSGPLTELREGERRRGKKGELEDLSKGKVSAEEQTQWMTCKIGDEKESYWKVVAEKRRLALEEILKENKELSAAMEKLKSDCAVLEKMAANAEYFEKTLCHMVESEGVSVLNRSVQTDLEASDFE